MLLTGILLAADGSQFSISQGTIKYYLHRW